MQNYRTATLLVTFMMFCLLPFMNEANAVFKVNDAPSSIKVAAVQSTPLQTQIQYVVESGTPTPEFVSSIGTDLPLNIAMTTIMPTGWTLSESSQPHLLLKQVSWEVTQEPFSQVLSDFAQREQIRFFVNWDKKRVTVLPVKTMVAKTVAPVSTRPAPLVNHDVVLAESGQPRPAAELKSPPPEVLAPEVMDDAYWPQDSKIVTWELKAGSLREQLEKWCEAQSWTMVWNSSLDDYILPVPATFKGEFKAIVHETFMVLRRTSDCGLKPKFYTGNNVVEVRDI